MQFSLEKSLEILERTPNVLHCLLNGISNDWTEQNEGGETWSVYDVIGHLIQGEKNDWLMRTDIILSDKVDKSFEPFDRFAQFNTNENKTLKQLLEDFQEIRSDNLEKLKRLNMSIQDLSKTGVHPVFGEVTLSQLLSTWVVHDLNHISQITRIMAKLYQSEVGPWVEFLRILK